MAKAEYRSAVRSRKLIHDALADLLTEKPLDKITVTDVVTRADINRGTFYAHYADIPDVINKMVEQTFLRLRETLLEQDCPIKELAHLMLAQLQAILEENLSFYRKLLSSGASMEMANQLSRVLLDYLLEHEAQYNRSNLEGYEFHMRFCAGGISKLYQDWFSGQLQCSLDELTQYAEKIISRSIE